ncbi:aldo/keto reductase [Clavibacter tessellarius]|uniref:Alcohol dehydrogenase n=1 Tax=Clavibacter tessellarius TaxID=31965 RepID=A0A225CJ34_9MICO|nr:aldo/keto reductase [Clavibacter michiganensis]MBT1636176.1 aldo/keto reductase [Clavibacter michiganensis]OQJ61772.1 alcohol dehydrogenase [Clavibacter michiganensis subsp. tessellarius]UKF32534.1 aldo/keto reductase [Clavibacter michiganensis subsp. tessellarius]
MRYVKLGSTGTEVSAIALGCMSYGEPTRGNHAWTLSEEDSRPLIRRAVELGITFFDTANVYSDGSSEEITGRALTELTRREEVVIATKVHGAMGEGPNSRGLSRKHIMWQIDESLRRLGTDYVDLYQIHRFDPATPLEETLEALDDLVRAGKVRYLGASSMDAWRFSKALHLQREHGWARFVTMQDHYNLVNREEEREMLPLCADEGVGSLPWSPLARGRLTRDWDATTDRSATDEFGKTLYSAQEDSDRRVAAAVAEVAEARGVPRAQVALAWVSRNPVVTAPIVGGTKVSHIEDAVASLDLELTDDEVSLLEEHYVPHAVVGY